MINFNTAFVCQMYTLMYIFNRIWYRWIWKIIHPKYTCVTLIACIWVSLWVAYKRKERLTLREYLGSSLFLVGPCCTSFLVFCVALSCAYFALFVFVLCLVCPMLPFSLDCPFLIVISVFSNVYFLVARVSTYLQKFIRPFL